MDQYLEEKVFNNPYIVSQIVKRLDIRSLCNSYSISRNFFCAALFESERRKDVIHLYLLNHSQYNGIQVKDVFHLFESFRHYTELWLNMRPKTVIIMIGGYRQNQIDYRHKVMSSLSRHLPKDCTVVYLDVGHTVLTSSIRYKSLTNYAEDRSNNQSFQRTAFPCMSCILMPDMDGVDIKTYQHFEDIDTKGVKSVLLFLSSKKLTRKTNLENREEIQRTGKEVTILMKRLENKVSFGGGAIVAVQKFNKEFTEEPLICDHLIVTFGGNAVLTASSVISTTSDEQFMPQLLRFKEDLDFDCEDWRNAITIGYIFANNNNFSQTFTSAFQTVFPCVGIFGFQTNERMYGKNFRHIPNGNFNDYSDIDPKRYSVIVLLNIKIKK